MNIKEKMRDIIAESKQNGLNQKQIAQRMGINNGNFSTALKDNGRDFRFCEVVKFMEATGYKISIKKD